MKKLLSILATSSLFASFTSTTIACKIKKIEVNYTLPEIDEARYSNVYHAQNPTQGMMNDIQGGFYRDGKWHVYFLQNADGIFDHYGHNHGGGGSVWYHATTTDWINWTYVGPAVPKNTPQYGDQASGTFYEDKENKFGYDSNGTAIIAITTSYSNAGQNIMMFYSIDGGYSFTPVKEEPILWNPHHKTNENFRDPYFFVQDNKYILYVAEDDVFGVWVSSQPTSGYQKVGNVTAQHPMLECPNLFEMNVEGSLTEKKWVLFYGGNGSWGKDADGLSTGTYYLVGDLDENFAFVQDKKQEAQRIDFGPDFYAAKFFSKDYKNTNVDSLITTAWVSNWNYNYSIPNDGRLGNMSLPREVKLTNQNDKYIIQSSFLNINNLVENANSQQTESNPEESSDSNYNAEAITKNIIKVEKPIKQQNQTTNFLTTNNLAGKSFKLSFKIEINNNYQGAFKLTLGDSQYQITALIDFSTNTITVDRKIDYDFKYGKEQFELQRKYSSQLDKLISTTTFEVFVDTTIVEFKFPDQTVFTMLKFPNPTSHEEISLTTTETTTIESEYYQITKNES